jgi:hypothetical protein
MEMRTPHMHNVGGSYWTPEMKAAKIPNLADTS